MEVGKLLEKTYFLSDIYIYIDTQRIDCVSYIDFIYNLPYFTDYKTHFFLQKIASKMQVRLILEINTKMFSV
jgi:hypothetical protein